MSRCKVMQFRIGILPFIVVKRSPTIGSGADRDAEQPGLIGSGAASCLIIRSTKPIDFADETKHQAPR